MGVSGAEGGLVAREGPLLLLLLQARALGARGPRDRGAGGASARHGAGGSGTGTVLRGNTGKRDWTMGEHTIVK